jgi:hypothetical protein
MVTPLTETVINVRHFSRKVSVIFLILTKRGLYKMQLQNFLVITSRRMSWSERTPGMTH